MSVAIVAPALSPAELVELPPSLDSGGGALLVPSPVLDSASVFMSGGGLNFPVSICAPGVQPGFRAIARRVVLEQSEHCHQ